MNRQSWLRSDELLDIQSIKESMKNLIIAFTILTTCVGNPIFSQHGEKFIDKKNELSFEENKGQMKDQFWKARPDVLFYGHSEGMNFFIKNSGMSYQLSRVESWKDNDELMKELHANTSLSKEKIPNEIGTYRVDVNWLGANNNFETQKGQELDGYNNYYNVPEGVEPALFVKKYASITLNNVWDGINLHYYGTDGLLETDYIVSPGADFKQIKIQYEGAELSTDNNGNLIIKTPFGEIREGSLKVFQEGKQIEAHWMIQEGNIVSFDIPSYNPNIAMVIDPLTRVWGTYYGGTLSDVSFGLDSDNNGNIVISGESYSTNNISSGGFQNTYGGGSGDAFVCKFLPNGNRIWATYFGGSGNDRAYSISINPQNCYIVSGITSSANNISTGIHQTTLGGLVDGFLLKLNSSGIRDWSTYLGGNGADYTWGNTCDSGNNIYVTGWTTSLDSIALNGFQNVNSGGSYDAFLMKFNDSGNQIWGTYYGGSNVDQGFNLKVDQNQNVYLCGNTNSSNLISSFGHQNNIGGGYDAFIVKLNSNGNRLWATYYGGSGGDSGFGISTDINNNVYLSGSTDSPNNISSSGYQNSLAGSSDGYFVKFTPLGIRIYGSYLGDTGQESDNRIEIDADGDIYLSGQTNSSNGIALNGFQNNIGGGYDAFIVKFDSSLNKQWGTYIGGSLNEFACQFVLNTVNKDIFISGYTPSINNIASGGYSNSYNGGTSDAFLVKLRQQKINASNLGYYGFSLLKWDLSPNPTSSEITITSDKFTNEPYTLYDQMGRTVGSGRLAGTSTTISLSTLSKGIYILKVEGAYESAIVVKE